MLKMAHFIPLKYNNLLCKDLHDNALEKLHDFSKQDFTSVYTSFDFPALHLHVNPLSVFVSLAEAVESVHQACPVRLQRL